MSAQDEKSPMKAPKVEVKTDAPTKESPLIVEVTDEDTRDSVLTATSISNVEEPESPEKKGKDEPEAENGDEHPESHDATKTDDEMIKAATKRSTTEASETEEPSEKKSRKNETAETEVATPSE